MSIYTDGKHEQKCYSGTGPWNNCFCKKENRDFSKCDKCEWVGTKHGLKIHKTIMHGAKPKPKK